MMMELLRDQSDFEYGWHHKGQSSWGANWHVNACNVALEQIRTTIARMVNLKELETFTKQDLKSSLNIEGASGIDSVSLKIGGTHDKSKEQMEKWVNQNNYLIDISDVRIKPGTDWAKGERDELTGKRTWEASATMLYRVQIFGKPREHGASNGSILLPNGGHRFRNRANNLFLDINNNGQVVLGEGSGSGTSWFLTNFENGVVTLQNLANSTFKDFYLDINGQTGEVILSNEPSSGTKWKMSRSDGSFTFQNQGNSPFLNYYLDINVDTGKPELWQSLASGGRWE